MDGTGPFHRGAASEGNCLMAEANAEERAPRLDAPSRRGLWSYLERVRRESNTTILLTTHYLEEAESLCEDIALISAGRIIARDTPAELKRRYDATTLEEVYLQTVSTSLPAVMAAEEERS